MKATEFVKKYGWERAKCEISYKGTMMQCNNTDGIIDDLQNLVNAYELVGVGLPELKKAMFSESKDLDYVKNWVLTVSEKLLTEKGIKLKQAIELVESVNE